MEPEYVFKMQPGGPARQAALPAPVVRYLEAKLGPDLRLIAIYFPLEARDPLRVDQALVGCRLYLEYAETTDPLGHPYWRPLDKLNDTPEGQVALTLMHHLAKALKIPTAADVEAELTWQEVPEPCFKARLQEAV